MKMKTLAQNVYGLINDNKVSVLTISLPTEEDKVIFFSEFCELYLNNKANYPFDFSYIYGEMVSRKKKPQIRPILNS